MITSLLVCLFYVIACICTGFSLSSVFGMFVRVSSRRSSLATLSTVFVLGQCILVIVWTILGLASRFFTLEIYIVLGFFVVLGIFLHLNKIRQHIKDVFDHIGTHFSVLPTPIFLVQCVICMILVFMGVFNAILPVRFGAGDGMFFYMVLPKLMAATGEISPVVGYELTHTISGLFGEMHHAVLLSLADEQAVLLFVWVAFLNLIIQVVVICGNLGVGNIGKVVAMAIVLSSTAVTFYIIDGKVDIFAASLGLSAMYWVLEYRRQFVNHTHLNLAGFFLGFAVVAKATYLIAVAMPVLILFCWDVFNKRISINDLFRLGIFACLPFIHHAAKNTILFDEPLAPFLFLDAQTSNIYYSQGVWNSPDIAKQILLTYPFALAYGDYTFQYGNVSGLYLALLPFVVISFQRLLHKKELILFTTVIFVTLVIGALVQQRYFAPRFMLPTLLGLIPVLALGSEYIIVYSARYTGFVWVIALCLFMGLIGYSTLEQEFKRLYRYQIQDASKCDIEGFSIPECKDMVSINILASQGDRVIVPNSYVYWLRNDLIQCMGTKSEKQLLQGGINSLSQLYDLGFRYVSVEGDLWNLSNVPTEYEVDLEYRREVMGLAPSMSIYKLDSYDQSVQSSVMCNRFGQNSWSISRATNE